MGKERPTIKSQADLKKITNETLLKTGITKRLVLLQT